MLNKTFFSNNEKGSAIVIVLMILLLLTIIGISSSNTVRVELQILRNDGIYKQNLYLAEAAAQEAIQCIWNQAQSDPTELNNKSPVWLNDDMIDMSDPNNWDSDGAHGDDNSLMSSLNMDNVFTVVDRGVAPGGSLEISGSNLHDFEVYGLSNHNNGRVFIQIGYRHRF